VHEQALSEMLAHPHFKAAGPKSLDRWDFTLDAAANLSDADGAATLAAFTARTAAAGAVSGAAAPHRIIACGGGRLNAALLAMIEAAAGLPVPRAEAVGWRGGLIEAEAFAYLAARTHNGLPISWPGTTGAPGPLTGGRIVQP
jgi:anhydro-N-acetylmuramic acid kinase